MSKKVFNLVKNCIEGAEIIAVAIVTFCNPSYAVAINASIMILGEAAIKICEQFVKEKK